MHLFKLNKHRNALIAMLFVLVAVAIYGNSLGNDFVDFDDTRLILENPLIREISISNFIAIFSDYEAVLYAPLMLFSFQIDYAIAGLNPFIYHLHSLLIHIISSFLVTVLLSMITGKKNISIIAGLVFLIHPLNTEAVAWVSARKDLLAAMFSLLTMITYLQSRNTQSKKMLYTSIICFALAAISKPSVITVPAVLPILFLLQQGKTKWNWKIEIPIIIPYLTISTFALIIGLFGNTQLARIQLSSFSENTLLAIKSTGMLLFRFFIPTKLAAMYPFTDLLSLFSLHIFLPALFVFAIIITSFLLRKKAAFVLFGMIIFLILLFPTFNSFRYGENFLDIYFTADRYAYMPMIGLLIAFAFALSHIYKQVPKWIFVSVITSYICILGYLAFIQAETWQNSRALFENTVRKYPNAQMAHTNIGKIYENLGLQSLALKYYERSIEIRSNVNAHMNIADIYFASSDIQKSIPHYEKVIELNAMHGPAHMQLGIAYRKVKRYDDAINMFMAASKIDPQSHEPWVQTGLAYELQERNLEAISAYEKALNMKADNIPVMQSLGWLYFLEGEKERGINMLKQVLQLIPNDQVTKDVLDHIKKN